MRTAAPTAVHALTAGERRSSPKREESIPSIPQRRTLRRSIITKQAKVMKMKAIHMYPEQERTFRSVWASPKSKSHSALAPTIIARETRMNRAVHFHPRPMALRSLK